MLYGRKYEEAVATCTEAIESGIVSAYLTRAEAYERLGMANEAEKDRRTYGSMSGSQDTIGKRYIDSEEDRDFEEDVEDIDLITNGFGYSGGIANDVGRSFGEGCILFVLCASATALGVLGTLYFVDKVDRQLELNEQRPKWPTVEGRVLSFKTSTFDSEHMADTLTLKVQFEYEARGQSYSGKQEWDVKCEFCKKTKEKYKPQYSTGALVPVYYNPSDPSDAVVMPSRGFPLGWLLMAILSAFIALVAGIGALATLIPTNVRRERDQRSLG